MAAAKYDLFISYADADRAWVEGYLLDALKQVDVRYHTEAAFALGTVRLLEFERAIKQSKRTLLVLSPAYLADGCKEFEQVLVYSYGRETATWPVIPLILQPVELTPHLSMLVELNATNAEEQEEAIRRLCAELKQPVPASVSKPACPYPGMMPFSETDSDRFFGRDEEIEELIERLRLHPFIAVIGPSGSGKSSLVFAGLFPKLHYSGLFGTGEWLIRSMRPGETPLAALKTLLGNDLANPEQGTTEALGTLPNAQRLLLVVDQFEEVFTLAAQEAVPFQETLLRLSKIPNFYLILTVRADFYPDLMESPLWRKIQSHRLEVVPLDKAGLHDAILRPAENVGVFVEAALVERLVTDAAGEPGVLPLIQETLVLLWEKVERRYLPLRAYEALVLPRKAYGPLGSKKLTGLQVAIARRADAALADLSEGQQWIARRIFLRLVQFGEGRADTRRQQPVDALLAAGDDLHLFDQTILHLADHRLLTLSGEEENSGRKADIAHEALISGWPTLQQWIAERREAEQTRRRLTAKAEEWIRFGKGSGGLLDEVELAEAQRWLESPDATELGYGEALPKLVQASSRAIQEAREREEEARKAAQMRKIVMIISAVALVGLAFITSNKIIEAERKTIDRLITSSDASFTSHKELEALTEGIKAVKLLKQPFVGQTDIRIRTATTLQQVIYGIRERNRLEGHDTAVNSVDFSPKGDFLASASGTTIQLWKRDGEKSRTLKGHNANVFYVSFLDDRTLISASNDRTIKLWSIPNGQKLDTLERNEQFSISSSRDGKTIALGSDKTIEVWRWNGKKTELLANKEISSPVEDVSLSSEGKTLASASADGVVKLWSIDGQGKLRKELPVHSSKILSISLSPDSQKIAVVGENRTVSLLGLDGQVKSLGKISGYSEPFFKVRFSPDGKTLASANGDGTIKLWSIPDDKDDKFEDKEPLTLQGHQDSVLDLRFSPNGKSLASASVDGTVKLWSLDGIPTVILGEHPDYLSNVIFNPNGKSLASASVDGTIKLWSLDGRLPHTLKGHNKQIWSMSFSPDGEMIASASGDKTVKLWSIDNGKLLKTFTGHADKVLGVSFSTNGETITSVSADMTIKRWNLEGELLHTSRGREHQGKVSRVSFSPDGKTIASASKDSEDINVRLWNLEGKLLKTLGGHETFVVGVKFSPDGKMIASVSKEGIVRTWHHNSGQLDQLFQEHLRGPKQGIKSVSFRPDNKIIASGSADGTVKLWNLNGTLLGTLQGHKENVWGVNFSPDGRAIASASWDKTVIIWTLDLDDLLERSCNWLSDYLKTNPNGDPRICDGKTWRIWL